MTEGGGEGGEANEVGGLKGRTKGKMAKEEEGGGGGVNEAQWKVVNHVRRLTAGGGAGYTD